MCVTMFRKMHILATCTFVLACAFVSGAARAQEIAGGHKLVSNQGKVSEGAASLTAEIGSDVVGSPSFEGIGTPPAGAAITLSGAERDALVALPALSIGENLESIIGDDNRFRITPTTGFPARAVVLITFDGGRCTGWLYGPDVVATAGHCVHTGGSDGNWMTNVVVYPGADNIDIGIGKPEFFYAPYGSCGARTLYSVRGWTRSRNEKYDYGIIKLDCTIGNTTGWFGYWWQSASLTGQTSYVDGYPGDKPLEQWGSNDQIRKTQSRQVFYENDTVGGNSGGPVWQFRGEGASFCTGRCVMAIHTRGLEGPCVNIFGHVLTPHGCYNHGTRIVKPVFNNLQFVKNLP